MRFQILFKKCVTFTNSSIWSSFAKFLSKCELNHLLREKGRCKIFNSAELSQQGQLYCKRIDAKRRKKHNEWSIWTANSYLHLFVRLNVCVVPLGGFLLQFKEESPIIFSALMFLYFNRKFWGIKMVFKAMKMIPEERYIDVKRDKFYEQ